MRSHQYDTQLTGRCGALRREVMVVLGIFALALHFIAGLSTSVQPFTAGQALSEVASGRFVICTRAGSVVVDKDGIAVPDSGNVPRDHDSECVFCPPQLGGSLLAPEVVSLETPNRRVSQKIAVVDAGILPARTGLAANLPRGPPTT
jgi:hypothetical protein